MRVETVETYRVQLFLSGPIDTAKQIIRVECLREGLCVTVEPTTFIYTGGEEVGYVVGLLNYPRFPRTQQEIYARARDLAVKLLDGTYQHSVLIFATDNRMGEQAGAVLMSAREAHCPPPREPAHLRRAVLRERRARPDDMHEYQDTCVQFLIDHPFRHCSSISAWGRRSQASRDHAPHRTLRG